MCDIIRNSTSFNLGRIYCDFVENISLIIFRDLIQNNDSALASKKDMYVPMFENYLSEIVKIYSDEEYIKKFSCRKNIVAADIYY